MEWRASNTDRQAGYNAIRGKRENNAGRGYTIQDVQKIRQHLGDRCFYCGCNLDGEGVVDHIIPIRHGGAHSAKNITVACWKCNGDKHSKAVEEFILWRKKRGLKIREGINWKKYRLPVSDIGLVELTMEIMYFEKGDSSRLGKMPSTKVDVLKSRLLAMIGTLSNVEKNVLLMRYGIDMPRSTTLGVIGDKIGVSQATVSGIVSRAMQKLRQHSMAKHLFKGLNIKLNASTAR